MSARHPLPDADAADQQITAERDEIKFLLPPTGIEPLVGLLNRRLQHHRFSGEGANTLPSAQHFITTIYFDTPTRAHYRGAIGQAPFDVKVRAKEYYDLHPGLVEIATDPTKIVRYQPWLWFEVKRRQGTRTSKSRFRLAKRDVPILFAGGHLRADRLAEQDVQAAVPSEVADIVRHCQALGEPLIADCLVNYRRLPWQDSAGLLRVTVDVDLAAFGPPADLWTRSRALVRTSLGSPRPLGVGAVVEIKTRDLPPAWLTEALAASGARPAAFSKFVAATQAIHPPD